MTDLIETIAETIHNAMRFERQTRPQWQGGNSDAEEFARDRARVVVGEMVNSVNFEGFSHLRVGLYDQVFFDKEDLKLCREILHKALIGKGVELPPREMTKPDGRITIQDALPVVIDYLKTTSVSAVLSTNIGLGLATEDVLNQSLNVLYHKLVVSGGQLLPDPPEPREPSTRVSGQRGGYGQAGSW